jgi:osmotically-inducible protein OsmY
VTLRGTVDTLSERTAAEDLARNTVGVKVVKNELNARPGQALADSSLARSIGEALAFDPLTDARDIHTLVHNGQVTLTGSVDSYFESAEALDDTSAISSVTRVDNQLRVRSPAGPYVYSPWIDPFTPHVDKWYVTSLRPTLSDSAIAQRIHENFSWRPFIRLPDVKVSVQAGAATLTGTVSSLRERQAAVDNALEAGAVSVDDELKVS